MVKSGGKGLGQTVEKPQELSGKFFPREVPREIRLISLITQGTLHGQISRKSLIHIEFIMKMFNTNTVLA